MTKNEAKRASMLDVARAANVSHQTVSRVINNSPDVSANTRMRVLAIRLSPKQFCALASNASISHIRPYCRCNSQLVLQYYSPN